MSVVNQSPFAMLKNSISRSGWKTFLQITAVWLFMRFLTSLAAVEFSILKPFSLLEQQVALWPPYRDLSIWLYRIFLAPWARYDAVWYQQILTHGYASWDGSTSFHPLFVLLSYPLYWLGVNASLSLFISATFGALIFMGVFYHLARLDNEPKTVWLAMLLMVTFPIAFILFAPYTESLFLVWAAAALYSIRREHWPLAALFSFLAALTRQQGLFLAVPWLGGSGKPPG
jgi:Gpi18-like mannosyltransferase